MRETLAEKTLDNYIYETPQQKDKELTEKDALQLQVRNAAAIQSIIASDGMKVIYEEIKLRMSKLQKLMVSPMNQESIADAYAVRSEYAHKYQAMESLLLWIVGQLNEAENTRKEWNDNNGVA
jgi:hypothetical protein